MNYAPIIMIDLDDTLEDLCVHWIEVLNTKYNLNVDYNTITWSMTQNFPTLTMEQICEPLDDVNFWDGVKPKKDAPYFVKKLIDEGYQVYICTASHHNSINVKYKTIIKRYFPFIGWDNIIVTSHKDLVKADVFIDDNPTHLQRKDCIKFLFDAPHNRNSELDENTIRVYRWCDIYDWIKMFEFEEGGIEDEF